MKHLSFILGILLLPFISFSQRCGTQEYQEYREARNPNLKKLKEEVNRLIAAHTAEKINAKSSAIEQVYRIPVVVHVIHKNSSGNIGGPGNTNVSDEQIHSQIRVLNEDFGKIFNTNGFNDDPVGADVKIQFCLATRDPFGGQTNGIVRTYSSRSNWTMKDETTMKALSYWPGTEYLNLWVADLEGNLLGYGQFPSDPSRSVVGLSSSEFEIVTDGVVIDYEFFGTTGTAKAPYNLGRTATHEVGHFLGLFHLWGETSCGDDYVADTPIDYEANSARNSCTDSSNCNGSYTLDMANNYMDYSVDRCMNIFTIGQKARMRAVMEVIGRRNALLNSPGCCGGGDLTVIPAMEDFEMTSWTQGSWTIYNPGLNDYSIKNLPGTGNSLVFSPSKKFTGDTIKNKNYGQILSPYLFNKNSANTNLTFDLSYSGIEGTSETDSLVVSYQANCGKWQHLKTFYGAEIITTTKKTTNFSPSTGDWKNIALSIPELANKTVARVRFEYYTKGINNLYLDNINIFETTRKIEVTPYPNPADDMVNFKILFEGKKDLQITIYNVLGATVYSKEFFDTESFTLPLNCSGLAPGVYLLNASSGKESSVGRLVVTH